MNEKQHNTNIRSVRKNIRNVGCVHKDERGPGKLLIELISNGSCIGDALPNLTKKNRMLRTSSVSFSIDSF